MTPSKYKASGGVQSSTKRYVGKMFKNRFQKKYNVTICDITKQRSFISRSNRSTFAMLFKYEESLTFNEILLDGVSENLKSLSRIRYQTIFHFLSYLFSDLLYK